MICSDLEYFSKNSVCLRQNFQIITQNYQCKPSKEAYIDIKLVTFQQFPKNGNC